ncbi:RHS repeat protein [Thermomonas brevis]|uniref:RHS repeat protein n=1 Tax=Thermomonas brevis TaxID=215691 RepID=A0A7G9QV48_9GAMM|nr:RHS repeat-associated core domain-containing protein [Thermomonas brevis]QNN47223.1 RHS repeat protein [Thermomonas brevis]
MQPLHSQGLPPSAPPSANDFCLDAQTCYPTVEQAEEVIRQWPDIWNIWSQIKFVGTEYYGGDTVLRRYRAEQTSAPASVQPLVFSSIGVCEEGCSSEQEAIASIVEWETQAVAGYCEIESMNLNAGSYVVSEMSSVGVEERWISFNNPDHNLTRRVVSHIVCDGVPAPVRNFYISKTQRFTCPAQFYLYPYRVSYNDPPDYDPRWQQVYDSGEWCQRYGEVPVQVRIRQRPSCQVGHPCHPSSGDKSRIETDFTFAGQSFSRFYHSLRQVSYADGVGHGWTHSFQTRIAADATMLISEDGYYSPLEAVGTNLFRIQGSQNTYIERLSSGEYRFLAEDGSESIFGSDGYLTSRTYQADPTRNVVLEYAPDVSPKQLARAVDFTGRSIAFEYEDGRLSAISLPDGQLISYRRDERGNLTEVDSGGGLIKKYHYDEPDLAPTGSLGLLTGITYESGDRYGTFEYDGYGRVVKSVLHGANGPTETTELSYVSQNSTVLRDMHGSIRTYNYGGSNWRKPLSISDQNGVETWSYDASGRPLTYTDIAGIQTRYNYSNAQLSSTVTAYGAAEQRTVSTIRDRVGRWLEQTILDADGNIASKDSRSYNARGQVLTATKTDPVSTNSRTTTTIYCEQADVTAGTCPLVGLVLSVDGARTDAADTTSYTYYASDDASCAAAPSTCPHRKGDLWKVTNALGHVTETLSYDGAGRPLAVKDPNSVITDLRYDQRGQLILRKVRGGSDAESRITRIAYWPTGLVKRVTQSDGSYTVYHYDAAQRLIGIDDNAGNRIRYTLDNAGNRIKEDTRDPSGTLTRRLSRVYDELGRLQSQADAYGHATGYAYDANANANATSTTDALGRQTANVYDPLNRLVATLQDVGGIEAQTQFTYDAQDNLTRVTDPKGVNTDYAYNGLGDLTQLTSADTGITQYGYDGAGNRNSQTDARGKVQTYAYDALNRVVQITGPTRKYFYDSANSAVCQTGERSNKGRLSGFNDPSGTTRYCYNRFGELTRKVQTTNDVVFTTQYGYDSYGRPISTTYPDGAVQDAIYDANGQVVELGITPAGGARQVVLTGVTYAPFGPATGWQYGNGRILLRNLNRNYQPDAVHDAQTGGLSLGYGFDAVDNLAMLQNGARTQSLAQYSYDALNRLNQVMDGPTGTPIETYAYDETGNRTSVITAGVTTAYTYSTGGHHLDKVGAVVRTYDASGNTMKIGGNARQFVYDNSGRMTQVKANGIVTRQYEYNAKGEQTRAYLDTDSAYFAYDEAGHLLGEYDTSGAPKQQMLWFGDLPVGVLAGSGANQQLHYIEPDHLGTPRVIIDGVRDVPIWMWSITGEAFGNTPPNQDSDNDGIVFDFDLRYPGQRYDQAAGLNYNYFRDYDPNTGRYVESDQIGLNGGISTFAYTSNNPLGFSDPTGLVKWKGDFLFGEVSLGVKKISAFSISNLKLDLKSDCVAGKRVSAIVSGWKKEFGVDANILPNVVLIGSVEMGDGTPTPSANSLLGVLRFKSSGGIGSANGSVTAGIAKGKFTSKGTKVTNIDFEAKGALATPATIENCNCTQ